MKWEKVFLYKKKIFGSEKEIIREPNKWVNWLKYTFNRLKQP